MDMEKRGLLMRAGVFFVVAAFAVCLGSISQAAPKSIKVSSVLSLTGKMSAMGMQIKPSYEIFVDKVNAEGGIYLKEYGKKIPIELRVLDDESDPLKTQAQLEVANSWGAVANLGGLGCGSFEMGTPICQKNKMTWVGPGCGGWTPHKQGNTWLFSIFMKTPFASPLVFDMISAQPGPKPKNVAIFEINQLDAQEATGYWREAAKKGGFKIVFHQKYPAGTKDFSAMITGAKAAGAEILLAYPIPPRGPVIVKQMKELDFSPKITYWYRAPEGARFGPSLGKMADYVTLPCAWSPKLKFPGNDYVNAQYEKKMGRPSDLIVGSAYSAGEVLAAGIEKAGTLDRTAIRDAVRATDMMTVCGPMRFSDEGWARDRVLVVLQWMGGKQNIVYANEQGKKYGDMVPISPLKWQPKWSER
jgi:branched-chain amino acid transport system substrate-binding protein